MLRYRDVIEVSVLFLRSDALPIMLGATNGSFYQILFVNFFCRRRLSTITELFYVVAVYWSQKLR